MFEQAYLAISYYPLSVNWNLTTSCGINLYQTIHGIIFFNFDCRICSVMHNENVWNSGEKCDIVKNSIGILLVLHAL